MVRPKGLLCVALLGVSAVALSSGTTFARFSDQQVVTATVGAGTWAPEAPPECPTLPGNRTYNVVEGTAGDDVRYGTVQPDLILGYGGNDTLYGGNDQDCLVGGAGDDTLYGQNGKDMMIGGDGFDTCADENGPDDFLLCEVTDETA